VPLDVVVPRRDTLPSQVFNDSQRGFTAATQAQMMHAGHRARQAPAHGRVIAYGNAIAFGVSRERALGPLRFVAEKLADWP